MGRRSLDDERQINRWKGTESRFKRKLVKITKDINGRFDDYSISPKIKQTLLHWGYELVERHLLYLFYNQNIYFFNNFCSYKNELLLV